MPKQTRILLAPLLLLIGGPAMSLEQPRYSVVYTDGDIEYRQYEPYLVAETLIRGEERYSRAGNEGFRRLFRYITGGNESRAKISMTAPVQQTPKGYLTAGEKIDMTAPVQQTGTAEGWSVAFMLPHKYTIETAPVPADPRVYVREVPGRLMAVKRFSSRWTEESFARAERKLASSLDADNVKVLGEMERAAYNGPFTMPFMRRNEVMVAVDRVPAAVSDDIRLAAQQ